MTLNVRGLGVGKWLHNLGAVGVWVPALVLVGLAVVSYGRFGSATAFTAESLVPSTRLKDIIFWSTIAFSLSGLESASMMGDEIRDPRRNIPRALLIGGVLITLLYVLSTVAMLVALPRAEILSLQGFMLSIQQASERVGIGGLTAVTALLITLGGLGQAGAWFAAGGRLPFVAGIDRFLPPVFGRLHPKYGSPHVSLLAPGRGGGRLHLPGTGGDDGEGRLRRAGEHGHHRVLHSLPLHVRLDDQAPVGAGGPRGDAGPGRPSGGDAARRGGLLRHRGGDRAGHDPRGGRAQQGAGGDQGGGSHGLLLLGGAAVYLTGKRRRA